MLTNPTMEHFEEIASGERHAQKRERLKPGGYMLTWTFDGCLSHSDARRIQEKQWWNGGSRWSRHLTVRKEHKTDTGWGIQHLIALFAQCSTESDSQSVRRIRARDDRAAHRCLPGNADAATFTHFLGCKAALSPPLFGSYRDGWRPHSAGMANLARARVPSVRARQPTWRQTESRNRTELDAGESGQVMPW